MKLSVSACAIMVRRSPPSRGAWIEIIGAIREGEDITSPPSRGAWIEIYFFCVGAGHASVAPLAGGVD